jgi:hypothetical protein
MAMSVDGRAALVKRATIAVSKKERGNTVLDRRVSSRVLHVSFSAVCFCGESVPQPERSCSFSTIFPQRDEGL